MTPASGFKAIQAGVVAPKGDRAMGTVPSSQKLSFAVYLNSRDPRGLAAYAAAVTNTHSATYGHYLSRGAFASRFGASASAVASTISTLRADGLSVSSKILDGTILHVSGSSATVSSAFHTHLESFALVGGGTGMATTSAIKVPSSLAGNILAVVGLNTLTHPTSNVAKRHSALAISQIKRPTAKNLSSARHFTVRPKLTTGAPNACADAASSTEQGYGGITDDQVASSYGFSGLYASGDFGQGQTVAVYELEPFSLSDVQKFEQCYLGSDNTANLSTINVDGGPGVGTGSGESALDIENVAALAPQANIEVYQASPTNYGALDAYAQIVSDDTAKVVTSSWGECESTQELYSPGTLAAENLIFEQAAAQGQSVFSSAGDDGADDCAGHGSSPVSPNLSVEDPASQPYVVSVGGTTALSVTTPPVEQVWNDGATGGATGGGTSLIWPMPSWQKNVASVASASSSKVCGVAGADQCRSTPDVSAFADEYTGITIYFQGSWFTIGGTSSSAPIWAAVLAEVNASHACTSNPATSHGVGFVNPLLYEVGGNPTLAAQSFNDVTAGNNDIFGVNGGKYAAQPGYDLATGFGTPNLANNDGSGLASSLCGAAQESTSSSLTSVSPVVGSVVGGTKVTITGTGFMTGSTVNVAGVSFGDFPASSFTVKSATTIVATTAPAGQPKFIGVTVPVSRSSLVEVTYNSGHVAVGPSFSYLPSAKKVGAPVVVNVGPYGGPTAGGNTVEIHGSGFTGTKSVTFGGVPATSFVVSSDSLIDAVVPAETSSMCLSSSATSTSGLCQTQVRVKNSVGTSSVVPLLPPLLGQLDYNNQGLPYAPAKCQCEVFPTLTEYDFQAAPTITSMKTTLSKGYTGGDVSGGDVVAIKGTGFNWLTINWVNMGDATLASSQSFNVEYVTYNEVVFLSSSDPAPTLSGNTVPVSVDTMGGVSNTETFAYAATPIITGLSTPVISSAGDRPGVQSLTITGGGFTHAQAIVFEAYGKTPSTALYAKSNFTVVSPTEIKVEEPSLVPGTYQVIVETTTGYSAASDIGLNPVAPSIIQAIYPGEAAVISTSSNTTCTYAGGCSIDVYGVNLGNPSDIVPVFGGIVAGEVTNFSETNGVDDVTITVPETLPTLLGGYFIQLYTDNGVTAATPTAIETYTYS